MKSQQRNKISIKANVQAMTVEAKFTALQVKIFTNPFGAQL
jgi:hypothetical protein